MMSLRVIQFNATWADKDEKKHEIEINPRVKAMTFPWIWIKNSPQDMPKDDWNQNTQKFRGFS